MFCTSAGRFTESACMWKRSRRWLSDNYLCILLISTEAERFDQSSARALKFPLKQYHTTPMSSQTCWASPCVLGLSRPPGSPVNTLIWEAIVRYVAAAFLYVLICIMARKWIRSSNWTIVRDINHTCIHKLTAHVDLAETETFCCLEKQTFSLTGL